MEEKKKLLTYAGLTKLEDELHDLKVVKRKEVAEKDQRSQRAGRPFRERRIRCGKRRAERYRSHVSKK